MKRRLPILVGFLFVLYFEIMRNATLASAIVASITILVWALLQCFERFLAEEYAPAINHRPMPSTFQPATWPMTNDTAWPAGFENAQEIETDPVDPKHPSPTVLRLEA